MAQSEHAVRTQVRGFPLQCLVRRGERLVLAAGPHVEPRQLGQRLARRRVEARGVAVRPDGAVDIPLPLEVPAQHEEPVRLGTVGCLGIGRGSRLRGHWWRPRQSESDKQDAGRPAHEGRLFHR